MMIISRSSWLLFATMYVACTNGFSFQEMEQKRLNHQSTQLSMSIASNDDDYESIESRREFFSKVAKTAAIAGIGSSGWGLPMMVPAANAVTGLGKVNAKLQGYGLPQIGKVPNGLIPLLEIYGKGANRFPILVQFCYPITWVVTLPSNDVNGEDGTVQAGDYAKGDTSTFYVYDEPGNVKIGEQNKAFLEKAIIKAISQKGDNTYQSFKITKFAPNPDDPDYILADFKYELLTGAGFEVDRQGVASITSQGNAVEVLWCAVTRQRYKKMEPTLRDIAGTFRCFTEGINLSDELFSPASLD